MKTIHRLGLLLFIALYSCKKESDPISNNYNYTIPAVFDDGLETATMESVGMDIKPINNMMNYLNSNSSHTIHNILIIKDNKLVFEEYFSGYKLAYSSPDLNGEFMNYTRNTDHAMQSISKSVTSVIFGIAVKNVISLPHSPNFSVDEQAILTGIKGMSNVLVQYLLKSRCLNTK